MIVVLSEHTEIRSKIIHLGSGCSIDITMAKQKNPSACMQVDSLLHLNGNRKKKLMFVWTLEIFPFQRTMKWDLKNSPCCKSKT